MKYRTRRRSRSTARLSWASSTATSSAAGGCGPTSCAPTSGGAARCVHIWASSVSTQRRFEWTNSDSSRTAGWAASTAVNGKCPDLWTCCGAAGVGVVCKYAAQRQEHPVLREGARDPAAHVHCRWCFASRPCSRMFARQHAQDRRQPRAAVMPLCFLLHKPASLRQGGSTHAEEHDMTSAHSCALQLLTGMHVTMCRRIR